MKNTKRRGTARFLCALALGAGTSVALALYCDSYINWKPTAFMLSIAALTAGIALLTLFPLLIQGRRGREPRAYALTLLWKTALSSVVFTGMILLGAPGIVKETLRYSAKLAAAVSFPLAVLQIAVLCVLVLRALRKDGARTGAAFTFTAALLAASLLISGAFAWRSGNNIKFLTRDGLEPYRPAAGQTAIHFLNVGSGDAILLESGGHFALIDAATAGRSPYVSDYVKRASGGHLDFVIGTHSHSDHIGGFETVILDPDITIGRAYLKRYDAATLLKRENTKYNQELYDRMVSALAERGASLSQDITEEPFMLGDFRITIFNGEFAADSGSENVRSMGVLAEVSGLRAFLAGDIESAGLESCLAPRIGKVDLLKAGHHGLEGSSTKEFVSALRPQTVILTTGPGGGNANVLRRFVKAGAELIACTGDLGGIVAVFSEDGTTKCYSIGEYSRLS
ncbi:MAG: MBL fold metallo-hydrolase [Oscillospiraceae bacterium]|nr:MBL fold metallo-hydrolase [Oscillospiraceae bacterium]